MPCWSGYVVNSTRPGYSNFSLSLSVGAAWADTVGGVALDKPPAEVLIEAAVEDGIGDATDGNVVLESGGEAGIVPLAVNASSFACMVC